MVAHYRWAPYWSVGGAGTAPFETVPPLATGVPDVEPVASDPVRAAADVQDGDPSLRSAREVTGYYIHASDGFVGHVEDLLVGVDDWVVRYFVVDTRNWLPGRRVLLSPTWVRGIAWADREVLVDHTREDVKAAPAYDAERGVDRAFEQRIHGHYGFAPYWI